MPPLFFLVTCVLLQSSISTYFTIFFIAVTDDTTLRHISPGFERSRLQFLPSNSADICFLNLQRFSREMSLITPVNRPLLRVTGTVLVACSHFTQLAPAHLSPKPLGKNKGLLHNPVNPLLSNTTYNFQQKNTNTN